MRLSPLDPETYRMQAGMSAAHYLAGRFDAASSLADKASRDLPSFPARGRRRRCQPHALAGQPEEGRESHGLQLRKLDPFVADIQSQGLASDPSRGRFSQRLRRLASGGAAGVTNGCNGNSGNTDLLRAHPESLFESRCEVCRARVAGNISGLGDGASFLEQGFLRCEKSMLFQVVKNCRAKGEAKVALQGFYIHTEALCHVVE